MSRLRVRTPSGSWLDICESEWYVRDSKNLNWIRLVVSREMKVRHGANSYWLNIECDLDDIYCPPEETIDCWPGYTGNFDSAKLVSGGASGTLLCDCDGKNCFTYYGPGPNDESFKGSYVNTVNSDDYTGSGANPLPCPVTVYGGKARVSEFYVDLGQVSGLVNLNFRGITHAIRVRIYKDCDLLADSQDEAANVKTEGGIQSGFLRFMSDTLTGSGRVLVRVDAPSNHANWNVSLSCPNLDEVYNALHPAPCYGTYQARIGCGNFFAIERHHELTGSGPTHLDLWPGDVAIRVTVYYQGRILATTGYGDAGFIKTARSLEWYFSPVNGDRIVMIRTEALEATINWTYSIYCPGMDGSYKNPDKTCGNGNYPMTCEDLERRCAPIHARHSTGATFTDTWYNLKGHPDGKVRIDYIIEGTAQIVIYDVNGTIIGGMAPTSGQGRIFFMWEKRKHGELIRIRVIGECCPSWTFVVADPLPLPKISVGDTSVVRGPYGTTKNMCYPVKISHLYDETVSVNYNTQSALAEVSKDCVQRVSEEFPFVVVPSTDTVFQTWPRTDGHSYQPANSVWSGGARSWSFKSGRVQTSINSDRVIAFISPDSVDDFTAEFRVGSGDDDNDVMGGVIAHSFIGGVNHYIMALRQRGGLGPDGRIANDGWRSTFVLCYATSASTHMTIRKLLGHVAVGGAGGWNGRFSRIKMERIGNLFQAWASDWNTDTMVESSKLAYDMSGDAELMGLFSGKRPFGFFSLSQAGGYFSEIKFTLRTNFSDSYPVPDYKPAVNGRLDLIPCEMEKDICIEVCGTDRVGPNRTVNLNLTSPVNAVIADGVGVGTIINPNIIDCDQNTQIVVRDGGPCEFVQNGARRMFTQNSIDAANSQYTAVIDMELNFPVAGTYTFALFGDDEADLYLDCEHVLRCATSPNFHARGTRYWVPAGKHYLYIVYKNTFGPARNTSYTSMAILRNDGSVFYSSNAAHWRGRVVNEGITPKCNQFAESCNLNPTGGVINSGSYNDANIGYPATRIQSALHAVDCAPADSYYVLERKMNFPESGTYSISIMADDNYWFHVDCGLVASGSLHGGGNRHSFHVAAGERLLTVMYKNIPNCTPGWVKFAIIAPSGAVMYLSEATGWKSFAGNLNHLGQPLTTTSSGYNSLSRYGAQALKAPWQPHYAWFTAERMFTFPKDDTYTIMCMSDDQMELFAACTSVGVGEHYEYVTTRRAFIPAGATNIIVRCFNAKAKHANWFSFAILDSAGNVVLVSNNAGAWKCRPGDVDRSNM